MTTTDRQKRALREMLNSGTHRRHGATISQLSTQSNGSNSIVINTITPAHCSAPYISSILSHVTNAILVVLLIISSPLLAQMTAKAKKAKNSKWPCTNTASSPKRDRANQDSLVKCVLCFR